MFYFNCCLNKSFVIVIVIIKFTCRYQVAILVNEIISNTGKYYNTIIAELFKNIEHVTLVSFKKSIKSYLLNDYSYICNLNNCYICQT